MDLLYIIIFLIPLIAQLYVKFTYNKVSQIKNSISFCGFEVAKIILEKNGLSDLYIVETKGYLNDHYDSSRKTIRLSTKVFHEDSIASLAVAAHECGHAIQDKDNYFFFKLRRFIFPIVKIGTSLSYAILIIGFVLGYYDLIITAILLVGLGLVFQLVTLPVEFDASSRAKEEIEKLNISPNDMEYVNKMLTSCALTYVAGVLASALEVLRLIIRYSNRRN